MRRGASLVTVTRAYATPHADPIRFGAGETLRVGREDGEFPGWFWCRDPRGKEGWVHRSLLSGTSGLATGTVDFDAGELTVRGGERGQLLQRLGGWALVRLDDGREGWLPESQIEASAV
jgi:SH3-like domain-containing protein